MGGAVGPKLAAAVSNAGGLGTLPVWTEDLETIRSLVNETRSQTDQPFAVNLNMEFPQEERLRVCLEESVPIISFFWKDSSLLVKRAKTAGAIVMHTVSSSEEAKRAIDSGVDVLVAQGWESGGHVRGRIATMALVPAIVDIANGIPVIAAGGISDGRGVAAALCLGASGAWIGTRSGQRGVKYSSGISQAFAKSERERHNLSRRLVRCWLAQCTSSSSDK